MRWGAEFWLRVVIVAMFCVLIIKAPIVLFPFITSLIITILLTPLARFIYKGAGRLGIKRFPYDAAILISFAVFVAVIYLIAVHVFVPFIKEFREFIKSVPGMLDTAQLAIPEIERQYQLDLLPPEAKNLISRFVQDVGEYTLKLAQFSLSAIFSFASTIIELIVVPFVTFYMMKKGGAFISSFIGIFPDRYHAHLTQLFREIHFVLNAYIRGQLLLSILMSIVVFLGMWSMNIPYPLVIGFLAGIVEMIPLIGPIIGAVPPVLLGLLQGTGVMFQVIIFYIIVQQLDGHFVMPKLMGSIIDVHPVAIIAGVLVGGHLFGVVGMMISVPLVAVLQVLLRHMWFYDRYRTMRRQVMKKATVMSTLKKKIKEHQYKFTTQRKIVLQAFLDSKENHMSAEDVYEIVHEENPAIGLATVYRSLELFTSLELLKKLDFGDGRSRYELNDKTITHSHHHLICLGCGKVVEFSYDFLNDVKDKIQKENGFNIVDYQLKFYGYCKDCIKKANNNKG